MTNPTFQIPQEIIEPIVRAQISAAIAQSMGKSGEVIERVIRTVLLTFVDSDGKPANSYCSNKQTWLDWAVGNEIKKAAQSAITESVAGLGDAMKKHFVAELSKKNSPMVKQLVEGMVSGVFKPENLTYRLNIVTETR